MLSKNSFLYVNSVNSSIIHKVHNGHETDLVLGIPIGWEPCSFMRIMEQRQVIETSFGFKEKQAHTPTNK